MMDRRSMRIYLDTSVFGGCFDEEFSLESRRLLAAIHRGKYRLLLGPVVLKELALAPEPVRRIVTAIPTVLVETITLDHRMDVLAKAYFAAGILTAASQGDLLHVATATVAAADAIVSWNFKHLVRLDKILGYNRVNAENGYGPLVIISPREVIAYEKAR